jgi:anti-sigma B factor antagonist
MDKTNAGSNEANGGGDMEFVGVAGDLDAGTVDEARTALLKASAAVVVADLDGLSFCDSAGLAALLHVRLILEEQGRSLALAHPPQQFSDLIELAGVKHTFEVVA